jgi:predicted phosphodiesterase
MSFNKLEGDRLKMVEDLFCNSSMSMNEIQRTTGVSKNAMIRNAKKLGWERPVDAPNRLYNPIQHINNRQYEQKVANVGKPSLPPNANNVPKLPESHAETNRVFELPISDNNILLISDIHAPYHDNQAIESALQYGVNNNVNTVFINGDVIDFFQLSKFQKDIKHRSVKQEFDCARAILEYIRYKFPTQNIYWLKGNHDNRYDHWLINNAKEIADDSYYSLEERLRLNELKIKLIDDLFLVKAGKLFITHGHLMIKGVFAPVNAARGVYLRAKQSCIIGHTHSVSQHTEKNLSGEQTSCWSTGCLCELRPSYDPFTNKHAHGFAHIIVHRDRNFTVKNYTIINGEIL